MEELTSVKQELERTKSELAILYEISNAMRTTLKLDEILYIILTGVTAHIGLGFNRAVLFLVNDKEGIVEGCQPCVEIRRTRKNGHGGPDKRL
jgi:nitrate/nitrite-specific signal transduction histidine kinase